MAGAAGGDGDGAGGFEVVVSPGGGSIDGVVEVMLGEGKGEGGGLTNGDGNL